MRKTKEALQEGKMHQKMFDSKDTSIYERKVPLSKIG